MPAQATSVPFAGSDETERERIIDWRVEQLIAAGFDPAIARRIGEDDSVDLHQAIELRASCDSALVERILR